MSDKLQLDNEDDWQLFILVGKNGDIHIERRDLPDRELRKLLWHIVETFDEVIRAREG